MEARTERWAPWIGMLLSLSSLLLVLMFLQSWSGKLTLAIARAEAALNGADNARQRWEIDTRNALRDLAVFEKRLDNLEQEVRNANRPRPADPALAVAAP